VVNDTNKYLVRLRKDVSFLNKAILKQGLEKVPANSHVIIDVSRADFIDQDILEIIEDFQKHAPLGNIKVEIKQNPFKKSIFNNA
jgi:MFS superfamily sulfate permease-like transporter